MKPIVFPENFSFADLELERAPGTKRLLYKPEPLAALLAANRIDAVNIFNNEDLSAWLIAEWYVEHRSMGGVPDPVAEEILVEVAALYANDVPAMGRGGAGIH